MYRIVLKNMGKGMVNRDFVVETNNTNIAVARAFEECRKVLGDIRGLVFKVFGDEINVNVYNVCVGSLTITRLS